MEGRSLLSTQDDGDDSEHGLGQAKEEEDEESIYHQKIHQIEMMKSAFINSLEKMTETLQAIEVKSPLTSSPPSCHHKAHDGSLPHPQQKQEVEQRDRSKPDTQQHRKVEIMKSVVLNSIETMKQKFLSKKLPRKHSEFEKSHLSEEETNTTNIAPATIAPTLKCSSENILLWKNIGKYANSQTGTANELKLLHNVSGRVKAGEIVAIMGHSGCGKSTLLNLLSGHYTKGMEGSIYLNDERLTRASRRKIAYVTQSDIFYEDLTVHEHLLYSAQLYLSGSHSFDEISEYVGRVLDELHIEYIKEYQLKVLSGGQRKRSSIGAYLVSMPEFLLLDGKTTIFSSLLFCC
jgi:ABC-type lipoprotein export system ATPase subunit